MVVSRVKTTNLATASQRRPGLGRAPARVVPVHCAPSQYACLSPALGRVYQPAGLDPWYAMSPTGACVLLTAALIPTGPYRETGSCPPHPAQRGTEAISSSTGPPVAEK